MSESAPEPTRPDLTLIQGGGEQAEQQVAVASAEQTQTEFSSEISDLINVDQSGRGHITNTAHVPGGTHKTGQFASNHEMGLIEEHQDLIRGGLPELAKSRVGDLVTIDGKNHAHRSNGQFLKNEELLQIDAHRDQIRDGLAELQGDQPEDEGAENVAPDPETPDVDPEEAPDDVEDEAAANLVPPVVGTDPATLQARTRGILGRAHDLYLKLQARALTAVSRRAKKVNEYLSDPEEGYRRKIIGAAAGAVVASALFALELKGISAGHHAKEITDATPKGSPKAGGESTKELTSLLGGSAGHEQIGHEVTLGAGHSVWGDVVDTATKHGHHLSETQKVDLVNKVMKANPDISWNNAHELPAGVHYQIPREVWEELTKKSAA